MTYSELHKQIQGIIQKKMKVRHHAPSYTANFSDDFYMSPWEINLLLYFVEDEFKIRLATGSETDLSSINQLVSLVHRHKNQWGNEAYIQHHSFNHPKIQIYAN